MEMKVLCVFWCNAENLVAVILRDYGKTIDEQIDEWHDAQSGAYSRSSLWGEVFLVWEGSE